MSVSPSSFTKQPNEVRVIEIDYSKRLVTGEAIASHTVVITHGTDDVSSSMLSGSVTVGTDSVKLGVKDGTNDESYKITCLATTDLQTPAGLDVVHEADIIMAIVNE